MAAGTDFSTGTIITSTWLNQVNLAIQESMAQFYSDIVGDGVTDDGTALLVLFNLCVTNGWECQLDGNKTYAVDANQFTLPAGLKLRTNGAVFKTTFTTTSNTVWCTVSDDSTIDEINIEVSTGVRRDRCLSVTGDNIRINKISVSSTDQQTCEESNDFGVRILGNNITIGSIVVSNYNRSVALYQSTEVDVLSLDLSSYVLGLYIFESSDYKINRAHIYTASPDATYDAGHNGVLISNDTADASHNGTLCDFHIEDAGEHGIRIGGALTQSDIRIVRPHIKNPGGCGIKILGTNAITPTDRNGTVTIDSPIIEDCGSGVLTDNMSGLSIMHIDRCTITNPIVRKIDKTYSSYAACRIVATNEVQITNVDFQDAQFHGLFLDGSESGDNNSNFSCSGGLIKSNGDDGINIAAGANTITRFNISDVQCDSNVGKGFNIAAGVGTITDSFLRVKCSNNTEGIGACDSTGVTLAGNGVPGATALSGITATNGSLWQDGTTLNYRKAGSWTAL